MTATDLFRTDFEPITVTLLCVLSLLALPLTVFAWVIVFDSTGLDTMVPDGVFTYLLPGVTAALPATVGTSYFYDRSTVLRVGGVVAFVGTVLAVVGCWTTTGGVVVC
ncbi:hypothetical protein [Halorussus halophilus]|uniref:hypothetical protein n=1 Tax=Halorussus halophilus TaxID=2650975 RepID=UPI0013017E4C|nr:hypothetical protein [Halorussus halophilus]